MHATQHTHTHRGSDDGQSRHARGSLSAIPRLGIAQLHHHNQQRKQAEAIRSETGLDKQTSSEDSSCIARWPQSVDELPSSPGYRNILHWRLCTAVLLRPLQLALTLGVSRLPIQALQPLLPPPPSSLLRVAHLLPKALLEPRLARRGLWIASAVKGDPLCQVEAEVGAPQKVQVETLTHRTASGERPASNR